MSESVDEQRDDLGTVYDAPKKVKVALAPHEWEVLLRRLLDQGLQLPMGEECDESEREIQTTVGGRTVFATFKSAYGPGTYNSIVIQRMK